jgi:hypothetical protein
MAHGQPTVGRLAYDASCLQMLVVSKVGLAEDG